MKITKPEQLERFKYYKCAELCAHTIRVTLLYISDIDFYDEDDDEYYKGNAFISGITSEANSYSNDFKSMLEHYYICDVDDNIEDIFPELITKTKDNIRDSIKIHNTRIEIYEKLLSDKSYIKTSKKLNLFTLVKKYISYEINKKDSEGIFTLNTDGFDYKIITKKIDDFEIEVKAIIPETTYTIKVTDGDTWNLGRLLTIVKSRIDLEL